jgi:cohesin loading factor subunit SCC2
LLAAVASPLLDTATATALQIVASIVNGALCSIKASPCNPLYVFTEDLLKALVRPEWPAAELLLRLLLFQTVRKNYQIYVHVTDSEITYMFNQSP